MKLAHALTGCHTESGRRPVNQDAVLAVELSDGRQLVAVADGLGGHRAGEVASRHALETIWKELKAGADLQAAVAAANAMVLAAATEHSTWRGMGTTLVAMLRVGLSYEIANVGDSRAYRITATEVSQITTDHSLMAEAKHDAIMNEEVLQPRWHNALTRALGTDTDVEVDMFGPFDASEPHALLLCSDGLHRSLSEEMLLHHVGSADDPWVAAQALSAEAYRNGSSDNISAAVILFGHSDGEGDGAEAPIATDSHAPAIPQTIEPERSRRRSRADRQTDLRLAVTIILLVVVIAVLSRVW